MNTLDVLHLSDLHCGRGDREEFRLRVDALIRDLGGLQVSPDLLVVSGDVAFSGQPEEYELALEDFFTPLVNRFGLAQDRIIVCPGNHDIDRAKIDDVVRDGIAARLGDTNSAQTLLEDRRYLEPQQEAFLDFMTRLTGNREHNAYFGRCVSVNRIRVGLGVFDSSWACTGDETYQRVFLTLAQVQDVASILDGCDLRIALLHHPLDWFHPSEQEIVQQDLRSRFDALLVGHKHQTSSRAVTTPSTDCLELMASSFFEGRVEGLPDGYCLYRIDPSNRALDASFRKFIRARRSYDRNVEHARDGQFHYVLPSTAFANTISLALARTVGEEDEAISLRMVERLRSAQDLREPILLTPPIEEMRWVEGEKKYTRVDDPYTFAAERSCLLYGAPDTGTSMFLEELSHRINSDDHRVCIYVDHASIEGVSTSDELLKRLLKTRGLSATDLDGVALSVVIDHVYGANPERIETLLSFTRDIPHVVICTKSSVLFDTFAGAAEENGFAFIKLRHWGPSRLREFTSRYIKECGVPIDPNAAYKFIADSLALSDLPVTPLLVALYLRVFLEFGGTLTGLTFVRLLERLEQDSLDRADAASSYSLYNLQAMLKTLATACYDTGEFGVPRVEFEQQIQKSFDEWGLDVDPTHFVNLLEESGLLVTEDDGVISFSCVVFFNYYLAQAIEDGAVDKDEHLKGLHTALQLGDALAYYAGRHRNELALATELMHCLEQEYAPRDDIDAAYLERYINGLMAPQHDQREQDALTQEALEGTVDYDDADRRFERDQRSYRDLGKVLMRVAPPRDKVEKVAWNILALKTFYNVLRNLENVPIESKVELLDRILDFHLHCNIDLIDLFVESMDNEELASLCAYMVTMGGEAFLSRNVGSASLKRTIDRLLDATTNDMKAFLLHSIYADLRLPEYAGRLQSFVATIDSTALIELVYAKLYELLVTYEGDVLPSDLVSAFNSAFDRRQQKYSGKLSPAALQQQRDSTLNTVRRQHLIRRKDAGSK